MKKLLSFLLILCSLNALAQTTTGIKFSELQTYDSTMAGVYAPVTIKIGSSWYNRKVPLSSFSRKDSSVVNMYASGDTLYKVIGTTAYPVAVLASAPDLTPYLPKSDTGSMLSPYLRSAIAAATYQPIGTYATASNTMTFTNKTWNGVAIGDSYISSASTWNAKENGITAPYAAGKYWTGYKTFGTLADSVRAVTNIPYSNLTGTPPIVSNPYFSPGQAMNPNFIVFASAIIRPSGTITNGGTITWSLLDNINSHNGSFFTGITASSSYLRLSYPTVKSIMNLTVNPDEDLANANVFVGPTVGTSYSDIYPYRQLQPNLLLSGAGTTTWSKNGYNGGSYATVSTFNTTTGLTSVTIANNSGIRYYEYLNPIVEYQGSNNYRIKRDFSGLGVGQFKFYLVDISTNTVVTTAPTSSDRVVIHGMGSLSASVNCSTFSTTDGGNGNDYIWTNTSNFWVSGMFEAYMVAAPVSTTSIQVRFQDYTGASSYKIYRATDAAFTSPTLIYSGAAGSYIDTGLTASTLYYYKMVAVVSGVDTDVTTFRTNTYY